MTKLDTRKEAQQFITKALFKKVVDPFDVFRTEVTETFTYLHRHSGCLNERQIALLRGLQIYYRQRRQLSERQVQTLFDLKKYAVR